MTNKINARNRRAKKLRAHAIDLKINRLSVFRSGKHIYAQVFSLDGKEIIAQASSLDKGIKLEKTDRKYWGGFKSWGGNWQKSS